MSEGNVAAALVTAMKGARLGPPIFNVMPRWLLKSMTSRMMAYEEKTRSSDYTTFRELAPTLHHDAQLIIGMSNGLRSLRTVRPDVLHASVAVNDADIDLCDVEVIGSGEG
jgi:hypothetical protein